MVVSWFSCGVSSAVATKMALKRYPDVKIIYNHIDDQHPDSLRFLHDCEEWFYKDIEIIQHTYKTVDQACRGANYLIGVAGPACSRLLKRRLRLDWEVANPGRHTYVWGLDVDEKRRAKRMAETSYDHDHYFPLIEYNLSKNDVHGMLKKVGIQRPAMYDMGYPNNNCIGCLRGGMGYWNKIRDDFPDVFESRCELELTIGKRLFPNFLLRDLEKYRGNLEIVVPDCGSFCEIP